MGIPADKVQIDIRLFKQLNEDLVTFREESGIAKAFISEHLKWDEFLAYRVVKRMEK